MRFACPPAPVDHARGTIGQNYQGERLKSPLLGIIPVRSPRIAFSRKCDPLKIQILSDLHLEFGDLTPPATGADVVVLAGDIHMYQHGLAWAQKHFVCPVLYVLGNHEFYDHQLGLATEQLKAQAQGTNVHILDNESIELGGVRFLGATLWTDYRITGNEPLAQWDASQKIRDFQSITDRDGEALNPQDLAREHRAAREFLQAGLDRDFAGKTIVITHHAPTSLSLAPRYQQAGSHLNASYASNLDPLIGGERVSAWIHGHVHDSFDYDLYGTRVICNPRGYAGHKTNPAFNPGFVIEI